MCPSLMLTVLVPGLMLSGSAPSLMLAWSEIIIITKDGITKKKTSCRNDRFKFFDIP